MTGSKTMLRNFVVLSAAGLFVTACADKRGFKAKNFKVPVLMKDNGSLTKQAPQDGSAANQASPDPLNQDAKDNGASDQTDKNNTVLNEKDAQISDQVLNKAIVYLESGKSTYSADVIDYYRKQLNPGAAKVIEGLTVNVVSDGSGDSSKDLINIEVLSLVRSGSTDKVIVSRGGLKIANATRPEMLDSLFAQTKNPAPMEAIGICQGDQCAELLLMMIYHEGSSVTYAAFKFQRNGSSFVLEGSSLGKNYRSFEDAQNQFGTQNKAQEDSKAQGNSQSNVTNQSATATTATTVDDERTKEAEQFRKAEDASMASLKQMQDEQAKAMQTHRQAEDASMKALAQMQEEQAQQKQERAQEAQTFREAEEASMKSLAEMQAEQSAQKDQQTATTSGL